MFTGPIIVLPDYCLSQTERWFRAIGRTAEGRAVFVVFTIRQHGGRRYIRLVSARYMHREEIKIELMKKKIPTFETDQEAREFVDTADLADYDLSGGTPVQFEFEAKAAHINMRVPQPLLDAVKERARIRGIPYTRFIRQLIEREISQRENGGT